jgi:transposase, IS30 family
MKKISYAHLTHDEQYQIFVLLKAGHTQAEIARLLNRSKSTICRELRRNCVSKDKGYKPAKAHQLACARLKAKNNAPRIAEQTWQIVETKLREKNSPEQISGWLKLNNLPSVSHESIYQRIYADKKKNGTLHQGLRCQKVRKKRYGSGHEQRGKIPNQVSIDLRPMIVDLRERYGDWEVDLVIGAGQNQALVTLVERKSRYVLIGHVKNKTAQAVAETMVSLLAPFTDYVHTITTDNGKEFAQHERIAKRLGADFYFAHPYSSWERGAIENMNGLIRQFFPKNLSFNTITKPEIDFAMNNLNNRPRKCLGFQTPNEVFLSQ